MLKKSYTEAKQGFADGAEIKWLFILTNLFVFLDTF